MKIINIKKSFKFNIGKTVIAYKAYKGKNININVGDSGIIDEITFESLPDFGLFNIRIIHMNFGNCKIAMGEDVVKGYFNVR